MFLELEEVKKKMISIIMSCIWVFISHTLLQGGTESSTLRVAAAAPVDPEIRSSSLELVLLGSTRHLLLQHSSSKPTAPHPRGASSSSSSLGFGGVLTEGILELDGSLSEAQLLQIKTAVEEDDDDDDEDNSDKGDISTASSAAAAASPGDDVMIQEEVGFAPCPAYLRDAIPAHHRPHHNNNSDDTSENMKETSSSCVILVPPLYVREFRWPLSQSQVREFFFGNYHKILHAFNQVLFQAILAANEEQEENTAAHNQAFILSFNSMSTKQSNSM